MHCCPALSRLISGRSSGLCWNISARARSLSVLPVFWKTGSEMHLPESMNPSSASIRALRRNGWKPLKQRCGPCTPAPWISLRLSTGNREGCSTVMNRWQSLFRECPVPITGSCSFRQQQGWDTATVLTAGTNIWTRRQACCGS